jgi:hypothetical protein
MPLRKLRRALPVFAILLLACALGAAVAGATAMVETREVRIEVNAAFQPRDLPAKTFAPVKFSGFLDVSKPGGGQPPALDQIVLDFDRDGRLDAGGLDAGGLPTCAPESIAQASVEEARRICKAAQVGSGKIELLVALPFSGNLVPTSSPLTLFNGPRLEGKPTVIVHAQTTVPATQTYAFTVPIEKRPGEFRYRATADIPPLAGGYGAITKISVTIGRRYSAGGKQRSYVAARCSDNILRSHGAFTFANGLTIEGVGLEKYCSKR